MVLGYKGLDLSVNSFHQGTELSSRLSVLEKWEDCERLKKKKEAFSLLSWTAVCDGRGFFDIVNMCLV